jgi:SDR family mycofactocin-dependent oxidoreductase
VTRVAVVTGAGRGIGAAVVARLNRDGWAVVATDVCADDPALPYPLATREELDAVVAGCTDPGRARAVVADVRDQAALDLAVSVAVGEFGGLDAAVAAAGAMVGGPALWEVSETAYRVSVDVNLDGVWRLARAAVPRLLERPQPRSGRFVALASAAAHQSMPRLGPYAVAKAGVPGIVRALAADLGTTGVTAHGVSPGSTATAMLDATAAVYDLPDPAEFAAHALQKRLIAPDEVAAAVAWLCSPDSSALTGATIPVDAGLTA